MEQSNLNIRTSQPLHVAIVMDGNGRWAAARGLPRLAGHSEGVRAARRVVEAAPTLGVATLTLFAFSADNWKRPRAEVDGLMGLLESFLRRQAAALTVRGVRLSLVGRRDRLSPRLRLAAARIETATARGSGLHLRLAVDYSARDMILQALRTDRGAATLDRDGFSRRLGAVYGGAGAPDVDLLIRTGGEQRLSDFLLWESAYAELYFLPRMWPDFGPADLAAAISHFHTRERRFGALPVARAASTRRALP